MKVDDLLSVVDAGTNAIAARLEIEGRRLTDLIADIKTGNGTLTADQEARANAITANLGNLGANLVEIGKDPEQPVPDLPPDEPTE